MGFGGMNARSSPKLHIQRPNVGSVPSMTLADLEEKGYKRIPEELAQRLWNEWCVHPGCFPWWQQGAAWGQLLLALHPVPIVWRS